MIGVSAPLVSVVVLTHNRRDSVLALMEALQQQDYSHREVILVDNLSTDGTIESVTASYPSVSILRSPRNLGAPTYNLGLANAKGRYVLLMDDDGLPCTVGWISQVVEVFESDPHLGAVACTIRMRDTGLIAYDSPQFIPHGSSASGFPAVAYNGTGAGLRMDAVRRVGDYPSGYFLSWIELHLCTRLIDAGWSVRYFPDIEVWHCRASGPVRRPNTYYALRNYLWYVWAFYPWPDVFTETGHYLASCAMRVVRGDVPLRIVARALGAAFVRWPSEPSTRRPISRETLNYLRSVRRCGNISGGREEVPRVGAHA